MIGWGSLHFSNFDRHKLSPVTKFVSGIAPKCQYCLAIAKWTARFLDVSLPLAGRDSMLKRLSIVLMVASLAGSVVFAAPSSPLSKSSTASTAQLAALSESTGSSGPLAASGSSLTKSEPEVSKRPVEIKMGLAIEGSSRRDTNLERQDAVSTSLNLELNWKMAEWAFIEAAPRFKFTSGHVQSSSATNGRSNKLDLLYADFVFSDQNFFGLSAGALNTSKVHSSLLTDTSMPGLQVLLSSGEKNMFSVAAFGLTGIPGSSTATNVSDEVDKTPSFGSAGLRGRFKTESVEAKVQMATFQYQNLPSSVANDSVILGNSGIGPNNSPVQVFRYQYHGYEVATELAWKLTPRLEFKNKLAGVRNQGAPDEFNSGLLLDSSLEVGVDSVWTVIPSFTYFNVEPDAVVANFNDARVNTNRIGYLGGLAVQYKKLFKLGGVAGDRTMVFEDGIKGREKYFGLTLEALNVAF